DRVSCAGGPGIVRSQAARSSRAQHTGRARSIPAVWAARRRRPGGTDPGLSVPARSGAQASNGPRSPDACPARLARGVDAVRDSLGVLASRPAGGDEALGGGLPATHRVRAPDFQKLLLLAWSLSSAQSRVG